jgi:hypothetical protein
VSLANKLISWLEKNTPNKRFDLMIRACKLLRDEVIAYSAIDHYECDICRCPTKAAVLTIYKQPHHLCHACLDDIIKMY